MFGLWWSMMTPPFPLDSGLAHDAVVHVTRFSKSKVAGRFGIGGGSPGWGLPYHAGTTRARVNAKSDKRVILVIPSARIKPAVTYRVRPSPVATARQYEEHEDACVASNGFASGSDSSLSQPYKPSSVSQTSRAPLQLAEETVRPESKSCPL